MRGLIIFLIVIVVVGLASSKVSSAYKVKIDFVQHMQAMFDAADNTSVGSLKENILQEAKRTGVELVPNRVQVSFVDTEEHTLAQRMVGGKVAQFTNKRLTVGVPYVVRVMGFAWQNEFESSKIVQIQARRSELSPEMKQLLE